MSQIVTAILTNVERDELVRALVLLTQSRADLIELFPNLSGALAKLASATEGPAITIGVHGGLVQWVLGNPFPIRICDYDGDEDELPSIDERDQRCNMWWEQPDKNWSSEKWRERPR